MLAFLAALAVATLASGAWCAVDVLPERARTWWRIGRRLSAGAVLLAAAIAVGSALRFLLVPAHHAMYLDEPWYAEAACNLARAGRLDLCAETWSGTLCKPFEKAAGWPLLIAPWNWLLGCATSIGITINRGLGVATVVLVALAARCAGARWWQAAVAALVLTIHPVHVAWSATGETNISASATFLAGLCGALLYMRTGRACGAALAIFGLALATAIRPEFLMPGLVSAVIVALTAPSAPRRRRWAAMAIVIGCGAAAAAALQLWTMNVTISGGAFLSTSNVVANLVRLAGREAFLVHGAILGLGVLGAAIGLARNRQRASAGLLLGTSIAAASVALAYDRFDPRMLLGASAGLLALGAFAFDWGGKQSHPTVRGGREALGALAAGVVVSLLAFLWWPALRSAAEPSETQMLETRIASRVARQPFAGEALFIAEQPTVLAAEGIMHVMATEHALDGAAQLARTLEAGRPVYFLRDMFCEPGFEGATRPPRCGEALERMTLDPVIEETVPGRTYGLYRVRAVAGDSAPAREPPGDGQERLGR